MRRQVTRTSSETIQVIVPRRRIQFRKLVDGVEVTSGQCSFDCLYFCWRLGLPRDVVFLTRWLPQPSGAKMAGLLSGI